MREIQEELFTLVPTNNESEEYVDSIASGQGPYEEANERRAEMEGKSEVKSIEVKPEDIDLVRKISSAIDNSSLRKATPDFLMQRGGLGNVPWCDLQKTLKKYFKHPRGSAYYVAKEGLKLPLIDSSEPPEFAPEPAVPPEFQKIDKGYVRPATSMVDAIEMATQAKEDDEN